MYSLYHVTSCLVLDISWLQGTELYLGKQKKESLLKERKKNNTTHTHTHRHITRSDRKREIKMKWKEIGIIIHLSVSHIKRTKKNYAY